VTDYWYQGMSEYDFDDNMPKYYATNDYLEQAGECKLVENLKDSYNTEVMDSEGEFMTRDAAEADQIKRIMNTAGDAVEPKNYEECKAACTAAEDCTAFEWDSADVFTATKPCKWWNNVLVGGDAAKREAYGRDETTVVCWVKTAKAMEAKSNEFTQMIWAASSRVAFGVKSPWVVAWYCPKGNDPAIGETGSKAAYEANVRTTCIEGGINVCYNDRALQAHNDKRLLHQDTPRLSMYEGAARAIQAIMDEPGFNGVMPAESERDLEFQDCAQSIFVETSSDEAMIEEVATTNVATDTWYNQGNVAMDYSTGRPRVPNETNQQRVDKLLYIIWKLTRKVAFGVRDRYVVAWYCDVRPLTALEKVGVEEIKSSPLLPLEPASRRRLAATGHRLL